MKKLLVAFALLALAFTAFGQIQLSAGAGASFGPMWASVKQDYGTTWDKTTTSQSGIIARAFVDARYVEADIGFMTNFKSATVKLSDSDGNSLSLSGDSYIGTWLTISAYGKYPFKVGSFLIFPLVGVEYDLNLSYKDPDGNDAKSSLTDDQKASLNQFWLKAGVGADFNVSDSLYIRPELLLGYKLNSKLQKDNIDAWETAYPDGKLTYTSIRLDIGVAVGFKF